MPPYCFAKLARPRWVNLSIISMLPIMGKPFGPGGYGAFRRILDTKKHNAIINGIMSIIAVRNGSSSKAMVCDFSSQSI